MKTYLVLFFVSMSFFLSAQTPEQISYQAVARNTSGQLIINQNIGVKLELHQGTVAGTVVFTEAHVKTTNQLGIFTLGIGSVNTTDFTAINWANGPYFLEVFIDPNGGTSYTSMGSQQLLSVPYALYAKNAGGVNLNAGSGIGINSGTITNTAPNQTVNISGSGVTGSYPNYTVTSATTATTTIIAGDNVSLNQSGNTYTVTSVTPTLNVVGGSLSGSYPTQTLTVPAGISYTTGTGISITSGSVITNTAPNQVVTLSGSGSSAITGSYPNYTVTSASTPSTTLTQGNNVSLLQAGSNYTVSSVTPTITAGSGITVSGSYPNLTIGNSQSYLGAAGNILISGSNIDLVTTGVTAGNYGLNASNSVPTFSVDAFGRLKTAGQYTPTLTGDVTGSINAASVGKLRGITISTLSPTNGQVLTFNTLQTAWVPTSVTSPTLNYATGAPNNTLTVGSNTVSIPNSGVAGTGTVNAIPIWTSANALGNSVISQNVGGGIVMSSTVTSSAAPRLRIRSDDYSIFAEDMSGTHTFAVKSNIGPANDDGIFLGTIASDLHFMTGNNTNSDIMVLKRTTNRLGLGTKIPQSLLHVAGDIRTDSAFIVNGKAATTDALSGQGKIYFNNSIGKFMVSENGAAYQPLISAQPWAQGSGNVILANITDNVGIGTNAPSANLHINNSASNSSVIKLTHTAAASGLWLQSDNLQSYLINYQNTPLKFATNGVDALTILPSGNVGIGNTNPTTKLEVTGSTNLNGTTKLGTNGTVMTAVLHGSSSVTTGGGFTGPDISTPQNMTVANAAFGDRVFLSIKPTTNAVNFKLYIAMCTVSAANNIQYYLGSLAGTVPGGLNLTIDYMIVKP